MISLLRFLEIDAHLAGDKAPHAGVFEHVVVYFLLALVDAGVKLGRLGVDLLVESAAAFPCVPEDPQRKAVNRDADAEQPEPSPGSTRLPGS